MLEFGRFIRWVTLMRAGNLFDSHTVMMRFGIIRRRAQRWLAIAEDMKLVERLGQGHATRYRRL